MESLDFSKGYDSQTANDVLAPDRLRLATDARISTVGRYETRKACDFYSVPAGETLNAQQTSVTGASDKSISTTTWLAAKFTTTAAGRLTKVELNLKNASGAAGPVIVEIYSDSSGPGTLLAQSSIPASTPTSSYAYASARFIEAPLLANATAYWIVAYIQFDGTGSYNWSGTTNATTAKTSSNSGVSWSTTSYDLNYKTYLSTDGGTLGDFRARKSDGTKKTIIAYKEAAGTTAVGTVDDVTGALTAIKTGLSSSATFYDFEQVGDVVYYVNGYDAPRKWDFTTESAMGGSPSVAKRIKWHKNHMFLLLASDPARADFSDAALPETFTSTNFIHIPAPKSNDPVINWGILNDNLYFVTTQTKWGLYGSDLTNIVLRKVPGSKGTVAGDTVFIDGNYIYFAAPDNFYAFDGTSDHELMDNVLDDYREAVNRDDMSARVWNGRLYIFHTPPGGAQNSKCWVVNLSLHGVQESLDTGTYVQRCAVWSADTDANQFVQASNLVGALYFAELSSNNSTNLGKKLRFELRTRYEHHNAPSADKQTKRWYPRFASANHSVDCQYDKNFEDSPTTIPVSLSGDTGYWGDGSLWTTPGTDYWGVVALINPRLTIPGVAKYLQLRYLCIGASVPVEFDGHSIYWLLRRPR